MSARSWELRTLEKFPRLMWLVALEPGDRVYVYTTEGCFAGEVLRKAKYGSILWVQLYSMQLEFSTVDGRPSHARSRTWPVLRLIDEEDMEDMAAKHYLAQVFRDLVRYGMDVVGAPNVQVAAYVKRALKGE